MKYILPPQMGRAGEGLGGSVSVIIDDLQTNLGK